MSPTAKDDAPSTAGHRTMHEDKEETSKGSGRTRTASSVVDADLKHEEGGPDVTMADAKPTYKSWKKKYRKMRIKFDESMAHGEQVYQQEQKALKKIKQLAIYNEQVSPSPLPPCQFDRLLDLLTDINNRPQIPTDKRFDVSLDVPSDAEETFTLDIDRESRPGPQPGKSLKELIKEVPHLDFAATAERYPDVASNLLTGINSPAAEASHQQHPPSFLTADDIDNYLWEIDQQTKADMDDRGDEMEMLPTLAPLALEHNNASGSHSVGAAGRGATPSSAAPNLKDTSAAGASSISTTSRDFALRNPTSVYNWLRKHAPNTFLQDNDGGEEKKQKGGAGEKKSRKAHRAAEEAEDDEDDDTTTTRTPARKGAGGGGARKAAGEGGRAGGTAAARAKGERASKRSTAASGKVKRQSMDETMYGIDDELGVDAPSSAGNNNTNTTTTNNNNSSSKASKRKRAAVDDDTGYRPKGGSSRRPTKKRNKNSISAAPAAAAGAGDDAPAAAPAAEAASGRKKLREEPEAKEVVAADAED